MQAVTTALNDAAIRPSDLDRVLLVGGSTRIPRITQLLAERLGQEPHGEVDPDLCVALGAGIQAGIEMGHDMPAVLVDITPYTFGTGAIGELDGRPYPDMFVPLIRRNAKLPAMHTEDVLHGVRRPGHREAQGISGRGSRRLEERGDRDLPVRGPEPAARGSRARHPVHLPPGPRRHAERPCRGTGNRPRAQGRNRAGPSEEPPRRRSAPRRSGSPPAGAQRRTPRCPRRPTTCRRRRRSGRP